MRLNSSESLVEKITASVGINLIPFTQGASNVIYLSRKIIKTKPTVGEALNIFKWT